MKGNLLVGASYLLVGIKTILTPGHRRYLLIPILLNLVILIILLTTLAVFLWNLTQGNLQDLPNWLNTILAWFPNWFLWVFKVLLSIALFIAAVLLLSVSFISITNLLAAPFHVLLASKVEQNLLASGSYNPIQSPSCSWLKLIYNAFAREIQKLLYYLPWLALLLILTVIPITAPLTAFLWPLYLSWIVAIQYIDYTADNQEISFKHMLYIVSQQPLTALGFGAIAAFALTLPGINIFVPPAAVAGGVKLWLDLKQLEDNKLGKINYVSK